MLETATDCAQVHSRTLRLVFLPAYHMRYTHGEKYTPRRAHIVPEEFEALIGGTRQGRVAAELHPSVVKAQVAGLRSACSSRSFGACLTVLVMIRHSMHDRLYK